MKKLLCVLLSLLITTSFCFTIASAEVQAQEVGASDNQPTGSAISTAISMSDLPVGPSEKAFIHNPTTYTNPISLTGPTGTLLTSGEPVITVFDDWYVLIVRGQRGYWLSKDFVDWKWVAADSNFVTGIPGFVDIDGVLYAYAGNNNRNVARCVDLEAGIWEAAGQFKENCHYGDASMLYDKDTGKLYMYYGWSQILGIRVVELDKTTFQEIGEPVVAIWGDPYNHGWETRWASDNIYRLGQITRDYRPQEYGWTEGGHPLKVGDKYYLMFASIGLEFFSYGHGVYSADNPMGPYRYSDHNPLTLKTTGVAPGGGHGSIFQDKNGDVWTICMLPYPLNRSSGSTLISLFPSAIDDDKLMYGKVEYGDYPQYLPGVKEDPINNNYTGWTLLSLDKKVEVSSTFELTDSPYTVYWPGHAVDEDARNYWSAQTGDPGEYITVDLGEVGDIRGIQILWDRTSTTANPNPDPSITNRWHSYTVEVSDDNENWELIIDKTQNTQQLRSDYIELPVSVEGRYVKLTNVYTPQGRFAVKALRVFGNPGTSTFTKVPDENVKVVRSKLDRRFAHLLWKPVPGAEGYVVRYGIAPDKLYNSYMVYWNTYLDIPSLNVGSEYYFEVEAFSSGTPRYVENTFETRGRGAELDLVKEIGGTRSTERIMTYETYGRDEVYVFNDITPGTYTLRHTFGVGIWGPQELTADQLIGTGTEPTLTALNLSQFGIGSTQWGTVEVRVYPGETSGRIEVTFNYDDVPENSPIRLTTKAHNIKAGNSFTLNTSFKEAKSSNAIVVNYTFDGGKFEYVSFAAADGVQLVNEEHGEGYAKITLMAPNYNAENLGDIMLKAKEDAVLSREKQSVAVVADYVLKDALNEKTVATASAATSFTTLGGDMVEGDTNGDGVVDLIDLSNMIDWFGTDSSDPEWESFYTFFDFNNNDKIDIYDITYVARLIQ